MTTRPILFSAPMVRAILDGTKTQTRRVVKKMALDWLAPDFFTPEYVALPENGLSPFGYAGDRLWVRETWQHLQSCRGERDLTVYRATDAGPNGESAAGLGWRPSIFMPRWASRIRLEITDVRVERLQEISEADAQAEGLRGPLIDRELDLIVNQVGRAPSEAYRALWDSLNAKRAPWSSNPWVWCVSFQRVEPTP